MTATLAHIFRHPIKGIGTEALEDVTLEPNAPMPGDRAWAMLHEGAEDHDDWQPRRNFVVVAYGPRLTQITTRTHADGTLELSHPDLPSLTANPSSQGQDFVDWVKPLWPDNHSAAHRLAKAPAQGMADNGLAQVSILNLSSLRALSQRCGTDLSMQRFRGNLWVDGLAPWEEFDLIGRQINIGDVALEVTDRIERCRATEANPDTGLRDVDPPKALEQGWGHRDFGVVATVLSEGNVAIGAPVGL